MARPDRRHLLRRAGIGLLGALGLFVVLLSLLLLAPVRENLARRLLPVLSDRLPGTITVGDFRWPTPGTLDLADVLWIDGPDTLVAADTVAVGVRLRGLLAGDLAASAITVRARRVDVDAITRRFPPGTAKPEAGGDGGGFPREGSLPGIPSVAIASADLEVSHLRISPDLDFRNVAVRADGDLRRGFAPQVRVTSAEAVSDSLDLELQRAAFSVDLAARTADGGLTLRVGPWIVYADLAPLDGGGLSLDVDRSADLDAPDVPGLHLELRPTGNADDHDLAFRLRLPGTEELADWPLPASLKEGLPDLARLDLTGEGRLDTGDPPSLALQVRAEPHDRIRELVLAGSLDRTETRVDTLRIALEGFEVGLSGRRTRDRLDARVEGVVSNLALWPWLFGEPPPLDSAAVTFSLQAIGDPLRPALTGQVQGGFRTGEVRIDSLRVDLHALSETAFTVDAGFRWEEYGAALAGTVYSTPDGARVELRPLRVSPLAIPSTVPEEPMGTVTIRPTGAATVEGVTVVGAAGGWNLDGRLDDAGAVEAHLRTRWSAPPPILGRIDPWLVDSLWTAAWRETPDAGFDLHVDGTIRPRPGGTARLDFRFPGPARFRALFPEGARLDDLGPLVGRVDADFNVGETPRVIARLDLDGTDWIDTGRVAVDLGENRTHLDTLLLALPGLGLDATADLADSLTGTISLRVTDPDFLARFVPALAGNELALTATSHLGGTRERPVAEARAEGRVTAGGMAVPALRLDLYADRDRLGAHLLVPEPFTLGSFRPDSLRVSASTRPAEARSRLDLDLTLEGRDLAFHERGLLDLSDGAVLEVDTLSVRILDRSLANRAPFRLGETPSEGRFVEGLDLAGDLGSVRLDGRVARGRTSLNGHVELENPPLDRLFGFDPELLPHGVEIDVEAPSDRRLTMDVRLRDMPLGTGNPFLVTLRAEADSLSTRVEGSAANSERTAATLDATLPVALDLVEARLTRGSDRLALRADLDRLPWIPPGSASRELPPIELTGSLDAGGSASAPELTAELQAEFPGWRVLESNPLQASLHLENTGDSRASLVGDLELGPGGRLTKGTVTAPIRWDRDSLTVGVDPDRELATDLRIEALELAALNGFLPADFSLDGRLDGRFQARGQATDLAMSGEVHGRRIQAHEAQGSQLTFDTSLELDGTLEAPRIRGSIDVQNGVIRIPEPGKTLLPATGDAVLWDVAGLETKRPDTTALVRGPQEGRIPGLELDVAVHIPSGLHIIGRQMDLELDGDLDLHQKDEKPTVTGDLNTRSGSIVFLGRTFTVRRGRVVFYGDDELDPTLDVTLGVRVEQYDLQILITGTAHKPELDLASTPELSQGDIMSVLMFGRTSSELGDDQLSYLGQRAGDVLAAYAAAELTQDLASDLGMDILTVRTGTGDAASLVVGKYLTSRALLKYEQVLHSGGEFFLNLEYSLTTHFKLNTRYGSESSGLELNWTNER